MIYPISAAAETAEELNNPYPAVPGARQGRDPYRLCSVLPIQREQSDSRVYLRTSAPGTL